jgi:hypothetical protein
VPPDIPPDDIEPEDMLPLDVPDEEPDELED